MSADASEGGCEWYFGVPFPSKRKAAGVKERVLKVGDRVKTKGRYSFDPAEGKIIGTSGVYGQCFKVRLGKTREEWSYMPSELTLLPPTFATGTRVRVSRNTQRYAVGDTGTVTVSSDESVGVRMDNGRYWSFKPEDLVVVQDDAPDCAERNVEQACWPAKQEAKPKFKAGDVVRSKKYPSTTHTIANIKTEYWPGSPFDGGTAYDYSDISGWDYEESIELVAQANDPATPCIVARVVDGKPRPSNCPHVHQSAVDATKEAERLASVNPGRQFDVYQRVTGRVAEQHIEMKVV